MALTEFELISHYFAPLTAKGAGGDDCAVLSLPPAHELAVSTDTLVCGIHFPTGCSAELLAWRAVGCCVSDLAAMGADPLGLTLALTLPAVDGGWLEDFSRGLAAATRTAGIELLGGDTTRGPLSLTLTVLGAVLAGGALRRGGGQVGDRVWVSGRLGAAAAALTVLDQPERAPLLLEHYWKPQPRLELGRALRGLATAAIDISDGIIADLGHLCAASDCGARLDAARVPLHGEAVALLGEPRARELALSGGDDYELCFTAPPEADERLAALAADSGLDLSCVGELVAAPGLVLADGRIPERAGYQHFGGSSC